MPHTAIETLSFFSGLTDAQKAELVSVASFRHYSRGEMPFVQGDRLTHIYWVCNGAVQKFRVTPNGRELTSAIRIAGDAVYDPGNKHLTHHTMNARAVQDTQLLAIPLPWMQEHIRSWDTIGDNFITLLARRAQEAIVDSEHQATMNATQIVACFLQGLCVSHQLNPYGFELPYSKSLIASRLGMELESFSRTLPKLKNLGITVKGRLVIFNDIVCIQHYACGSCTIAEECSTHQAMHTLVEKSADQQKIPA